MTADLVRAGVAELIGTFVFVCSVWSVGGSTLAAPAIAGTLMAVIFTFGAVSGGHFNPAITASKFLAGAIAPDALAAYVAAQLLGGAAALAAWRWMMAKARQ